MEKSSGLAPDHRSGWAFLPPSGGGSVRPEVRWARGVGSGQGRLAVFESKVLTMAIFFYCSPVAHWCPRRHRLQPLCCPFTSKRRSSPEMGPLPTTGVSFRAVQSSCVKISDLFSRNISRFFKYFYFYLAALLVVFFLH